MNKRKTYGGADAPNLFDNKVIHVLGKSPSVCLVFVLQHL